MKFTVLGNTQVTVSVQVEADSEKEAYEKAKKQFKGIHAYVGNGGTDKLIGVEGEHETIAADEPVTFDDCLPE